MFIQDIRITGVPDLDHIDKVNITKRWRYQQTLRETFRRRFRDEYLSLLIQRPLKSKHLIRELKVGDIVFVCNDNKKRLDWPLGRIISTFPGKDQNVRVVRVKTATGEFNRPVQKIHPLEITHHDFLFKKKRFTETKSDHQDEFPEITKSENMKTEDLPVKTRCGRTVVKPSRFIEFEH